MVKIDNKICFSKINKMLREISERRLHVGLRKRVLLETPVLLLLLLQAFGLVVRVDNVGRLIDLCPGEDGGNFGRLFHRHDVAAAADVGAARSGLAVALDLVQLRVRGPAVDDLEY